MDVIVGSSDQDPDNSEMILSFSLVFVTSSILTTTRVPSGRSTFLGSRIEPFSILLLTIIVIEYLPIGFLDFYIYDSIAFFNLKEEREYLAYILRISPAGRCSILSLSVEC
jgi:hypothetical protein